MESKREKKTIIDCISEEQVTIEGLLPGCVLARHSLTRSSAVFSVVSYRGREIVNDMTITAFLEDGTHAPQAKLCVKRGKAAYAYSSVATCSVSRPTELPDALADAFRHSYPATGINWGTEVLTEDEARKKAEALFS